VSIILERYLTLNAETHAFEIQLGRDWDIRIDNEFATRVFSANKTSKALLAFPKTTPSSNLCNKCENLRDRIWDSTFNDHRQTSKLKEVAQAGLCDLCGLLWRTCERYGATGYASALFERMAHP